MVFVRKARQLIRRKGCGFYSLRGDIPSFACVVDDVCSKGAPGVRDIPSSTHSLDGVVANLPVRSR